MSEKPLVSVVIPTWNSSRTIESCLSSITNQSYKNVEILVVDGGSFDNTLGIARKYKTNIILSRRGRAIQRNTGALNAKGEFLFHVDSDEVLHPKIIEECVREACNKKLDAIFISTIDTGETYIGKSRCLGNIINLILNKDIYIPNSALRFYNKRTFNLLGGYDNKIVVGEDVLFALKCLKFGLKIGRCKYPILHYGAEKLKDIFLKKYYYGKTLKRYIEASRKFNFNVPKRYIEVGIFYFMHLFKFKKYARYLPGFLLVKLIEMLGLIIGNFLGL